MKHQLAEVITLLRTNIRNSLSQRFVAKDDIIDLMLVSVIAQEHMLLVGPPGTGKSELIKRFVTLLGVEKQRGELFEYLLTRFTEPNEIFGPVNIQAFQNGTFTRTTDRALPQARIAFLDEVFKANSAILNTLLTILNERYFFNGVEQMAVPLMSLFGATNDVPESDDLSALYDRFLLRVRTDNVPDRHVRSLIDAGWALEQERIREGRNETLAPILDSIDDLGVAYQALEQVDLRPIYDDYREVIRQIRAEGITVSDRRVVKLLKVIAAATLLRQETHASPADFWVLMHIWNTPAQLPTLQTIVAPLVEQAGGGQYTGTPSLQTLEDDLLGLQRRVAEHQNGISLTTASQSALLHDLERLRQETFNHRDCRMRQMEQERCHRILHTVEQLIDTVLDWLEEASYSP